MKQKYRTNIPADVYRYLLPFFYLTRNFDKVDVKDRFFAPQLERMMLREWLGDRRDLFVGALKWALAHPERDYRIFLPDYRKHLFSNEDCLKMFALFLRSLEHLFDEGPDIVEQFPYYLDVPGDLDYKK